MKEQVVRLTAEAKELYPQFEGMEDYEEAQIMFEMTGGEKGDVMLFQPLYNRKIWNMKYLEVVRTWESED